MMSRSISARISQTSKRLRYEYRSGSILPDRFTVTLQKCISGRYLGEIFRLIMLDLIKEGVLFSGQKTQVLEAPYCFETAYLSMMER